jgi:CelD/BcsL family acetyltransferase involved in cellulose biosynthesis
MTTLTRSRVTGRTRLVRIVPTAQDWTAMDALADRVVMQTPEWLAFLQQTQRAEPVVARVEHEGVPVGWFTGLVQRRFGFRILGSPFAGWSTQYLGFNLDPDFPRRHAWQGLRDFALGELGCVHVEVRDRWTVPEDVAGLGLQPLRPLRLFHIDLRRTEDELLAAMALDRRRGIRTAQRRGVVIEEATDATFVDDYYPQLLDVFAKQSLVPTYGPERVTALIQHLLPTGRLLLLRARDADGTCVASGIFPAHNGWAHFWGGASFRTHQSLHPNELMLWTAMQTWRSRGVTDWDFGGAGDYKRRYGVVESTVPAFSASRPAALLRLRHAAAAAAVRRQRLLGARSVRTRDPGGAP